MSSFPTTSTTLLANLAEQESGIDQAEWNRFFALYYPVMVEFARARGAGDDSEDVVQEVFADLVKVFQAGRYVRGKGQFKSYLATMLRNELISRFRRMQARFRVDGRAQSPSAPPVAPSVSSSADDMPAWNLARHRAAVEHVLTRTAISDKSRRIYRELLATGDNCAKVARRMNLPAATVRQVKSRVSRMIAAFEKATE
jgi:RNA polymerase sigma factor (sigma-70 family)